MSMLNQKNRTGDGAPFRNRGLWFAWVFLLLTGCVVGPNYRRPAAVTPPAFKEGFSNNGAAEGWKIAQPGDDTIRGKWWEMYEDPQLNALEEQVSISNQNIIAAEAQYREARDAVRVARSGLFPTISAGPSITSSRSSQTLFPGGQLSSFVAQRTTESVPVMLNYEADLWGSIRRSVTQQVANAQASAAQLENAKLSFEALLANDYFALHGLDADADLLERTVKSYEAFLELTKVRFNAGVASDADVAQAETQLQTARADLVDVGVDRAQFEHAIAILIGKPPSELSISRQLITSPLPNIPVAVPASLLERRPDIASFERQVAAANESIGIAKAAFYPALNLAATFGFQTANLGQLFNWPSRFWSVGPTLTQTLFDKGRRKAQLSITENAYDATVAAYRESVLTAFQQVEDSLSALRILADESRVRDDAVKASLRALDVSTEQYKAGIADYLQVITTQTAAFTSQRSAIDVRTRRYTSSVALVQSLGGGWDASKLPQRKEIVQGK